MRPLNILVCGGDTIALRKITTQLMDDGVNVRVINLLSEGDLLCDKRWDFLLIDLDGLNSFLRRLLPVLRKSFPKLLTIGLSRCIKGSPETLRAKYGLELDAYTFEIPRPEDLIVRFPRVAARYMPDTKPLSRKPDTRPLAT